LPALLLRLEFKFKYAATTGSGPRNVRQRLQICSKSTKLSCVQLLANINCGLCKLWPIKSYFWCVVSM